MPAFVEHKFRRGFLLDEERLRKIHDLIEERISKYPNPPSIRYKVYRGDSYSYETDSVSVITEEDNEDWRAITRLEILVRQPEVFNFDLSFQKKGTTLEISGDDRDAVFLIFSDLRSYLEERVLVKRMLSENAAKVAALIVMMLGMVFFVIYALVFALTPDHAGIKAALATEDIGYKLDYLIDSRNRSAPGRGFIGVFIAAMLLAAIAQTPVIEAAWKVVFPHNLFLFGKKKEEFDRRRSLLGRIFWVVIVGLLVSGVAGLFVWWLTK